VRLEDATLIVDNNLRMRPTATRPTGIGLINLRERFRIVTGRAIVWAIEHDRFIVRLPLVSNPTRPSDTR